MKRWVAFVAFGLVALFASAFTATGEAVQQGPGTSLSGGITFDHESIVDPFRLVGEPDIALDSKGGIYTSGPGGSPTQHSWFWKSDDGGIQWHGIGVVPEYKGNGTNGGGDTEIAIGKDDSVYAADLQTLVCQGVYASHDRGKTFTQSEGCIPGSDREWMGTYTDPATGQSREYLASNGDIPGCYMLVSTNGGATYTPTGSSGALGSIDGNDCAGRFVVDQRNGHIFAPMSGGGIDESTDGGNTWDQVGDTGAEENLFASLTIDNAGNLYQAWTTNDYKHTYLSVSTDEGRNWDRFQVNTADVKQMVFPWAVAGDAGRVAVVFYGTNNTKVNNGWPGDASALWHAYAVFSTDATSGAPAFQQLQIDEHPMHVGTICLGGFPGCLTAQADRSMADFFEVGMDPRDGRVFVVFNDNADTSDEQPDLSPTVKNLGKAIVAVARERTGPSLLERPDLLPVGSTVLAISAAAASGGMATVSGTHGLPPGNWSSDPGGDAMWPVVPQAGPNNPALDIREASLADNGQGTLTFKVSLADLSTAALLESGQSVGQPAWVFFWNYNNKHYFVKFLGKDNQCLTGGSDAPCGPTAEYGQVGAINWPALGAPAPKFLTYVPSGTTTALITGNTLSIDLPASAVGDPPAGAKLDTITAYTWSEKGPSPSVVDQARSFSYVVGTSATAQHAADGYVQVSVDDPTFANPVTATLTGANGFSAQVGPLAAGTHTLYVRQVLSSALYTSSWDDVAAGAVATITVQV
ncbi:MAG: hypothetical protein ABR600_14010 [Actinomycetota bacterium]